MSSFLEAIGSLFTFFFTQLGNFASFFTTNTLGQIILGCAMFSLIIFLLFSVINLIRKN